jgi:hypothetical protein
MSIGFNDMHAACDASQIMRVFPVAGSCKHSHITASVFKWKRHALNGAPPLIEAQDDDMNCHLHITPKQQINPYPDQKTTRK